MMAFRIGQQGAYRLQDGLLVVSMAVTCRSAMGGKTGALHYLAWDSAKHVVTVPEAAQAVKKGPLVARLSECMYICTMGSQMVGTVVRGINNIFTVVPEREGLLKFTEGPAFECRIKGKVLSGVPEDYSPLAVGDRVACTQVSATEGLILERLERHASFVRWNAKRGCDQTVVANMDVTVIVASVDEPPFRPRFVDRAIACTRGCPVLIVLNKCDLQFTESEEARFRLYGVLGYETFTMSAYDLPGIEALKSRLFGKTCAFVGQSGVGKSTLVNALAGTVHQRTGLISDKFNRGRHTTNHAILIPCDGFAIVDTPGVRELLVPHGEPQAVVEAFPEFARFAASCSFQSCCHRHEPDCAVKRAVENGLIDEDRYESYLRMLVSFEQRPQAWESDRR